MKIKSILTAFCLATFCQCTAQSNSEITKVKWLVGTWENKTPRGSIYEYWVEKNDNELSGMSFMIQDQDTVVFERVSLIQEAGGLFYIPIVNDQNDGMPVRFGLNRITEEGMLFENPAHDFPQFISYSKVQMDSLVAEISGVVNGQERKQTFPMKRIK